MQSTSLIYFAVFAFVQVAMYILIRRRIGHPAVIAAIGVVISFASLLFMALEQGTTLIWAVIVGLVLGGLFSGISLAAAWYFTTNENRRSRFDPTVSDES